jgi:hypothetical protein
MPIESESYRDAFADMGTVSERRARIEREEQERAAERQREVALQASPFSDPEARIRQWEKLHALRLPKSPAHKLLQVIAMQTELSLQQILEIQRRRAAPAPISSAEA